MKRFRIVAVIWLTVLALAAVLTGAWLYAAALAISLILLVVSVVFGCFTGRKVTVHLDLQKMAGTGMGFHGTMVVENASLLPVFHGRIPLSWENLLTGERGSTRLDFLAGGRCRQERKIIGEEQRCGCVRMTVEGLQCSDFCGLARFVRKAADTAYTVMLPEESRIDLSVLQEEGFDMESFHYSASRPGEDPGEAYAIRDYRPGDSIRQIHWKLTGKLEEPVIRERSYPVDDTVLVLAEAFRQEKKAGAGEAVAEIFAAVLHTFLEQGIACQAAVWNPQTGRLWMQRIRSGKDCEEALYLFLRYGSSTKGPAVVREYRKVQGAARFPVFLYITGDPQDQEARILEQTGKVQVLRYGSHPFRGPGELIFTDRYREELGMHREHWKTHVKEHTS